MPNILGVNFLGGLKSMKNKVENFAEKLSSKFAEKFTGNFPKIRWAKI